MSEPENKAPTAGAEPLEIRPLTDAEIGKLEKILGPSFSREHLVFWLSRSIRDLVTLSSQTSARHRRDDFRRIAKEGRHWVRGFKMSPDLKTLQARARLKEVKIVVNQFCETVESLSRELQPAIKRGKARTPYALDLFLEQMIGIAKTANILPNIPGRAVRSQTAPQQPSAFFRFIKGTLAVAREVITSSEVPSPTKYAALETLRNRSDDALVKILVRLRGKVGNYRKGPHGVTEWNRWKPRRRAPRKKR